LIASKTYIGRFAPSPSGGLHFGSLLTALASYLDARFNQGQWLLRIDNIDPPREIAGATENIIRTLEAFGLDWDGKVIYQSHRYPSYLGLIYKLVQEDLAYPCYCSRKQLSLHEKYPGTCRKKLGSQQKKNLIDELKKETQEVFSEKRPEKLNPHLFNYSIRFNTEGFNEKQLEFIDILRSKQSLPSSFSDFIILRKDRLPSYMLACAFDDIHDGISRLVRGADLLESCFWQRSLQSIIVKPKTNPIEYAHLPVIKNELDQKLSKQHYAPEVNDSEKEHLLLMCLKALGQKTPESVNSGSVSDILAWAVSNWRLENVPKHDIYFSDILC